MSYKLFKKGETIDGKDLIAIVNQMFNIDMDYTRAMMDRIIYRNILYYIGEQWIEYTKARGSFQRRDLPPYIPTPVANEIRQFVRSARSLFLSQNLIPTVRPNTNEKEDERAAKLGSDVLIWMDTLNDEEISEEKEKVCDWMSLAGTGFLRTTPQMDGGKWFVDKKGTIIKTGEVSTRNIIPFNVILDNIGENLRDKRWIGIKTLVAREWVEDTFKVKIAPESQKAVDYQKKLMKLVSQVSAWKGHGLETSSIDIEEKEMVLFKEIEIRPSLKYSEGKYIVTCSDQLLRNVDRMPIKAEKGKWYYTLTDFHFDKVPGRFWSDPGVNDLISPQNTINEIDQSLKMNRKGLGRPRIISPGEIGLKRLSNAGQGFVVIKYDPLMSGGREPKFEGGIALPQQVLAERDAAKTQIQDSSGDPKNILKGQAPTAKASGVMVDILRETAERGHVPDLDRYHRSMNTVYKKRLLLAKEIVTEERMIKIVGRGNRLNVRKFKGSDLRDNTDVRLELDSGLSTTKAGQREILLQLAQYQVLDMRDPEVKQEYLERVGLSGFAERLNIDIERAEVENSKIATGDVEELFIVDMDDLDPETGEPKELMDDPLFEYDNHAIHYEIHRRFILSPEFMELSAELKEIALGHIAPHQIIMKQQQAEQFKMQMKMEGKGEQEDQESVQEGGPETA